MIDVRNPKGPRAANFLAAPPNTWNIHLQAHDDLLLVIDAKDMFAAAEFADERAYYRGALGKTSARRKQSEARLERGPCGLRISKPDTPRQIGFMPVDGGGIHRVWYTGGRWAYASVLLDGFTDYIFMIVDMGDPAKPREAGRWWIPGMNRRPARRLMGRGAPIRPAPRHHPRRYRICSVARCRHGGARHRRPRENRN